MKILYVLVLYVFLLSVTGTVYAQTNSSSQTNSTSKNSLQKMFNPANAQTNIYNDSSHNFSIMPPDGWEIQSQSNGTKDALVVFSNHNPASLANFGIYYSRQNPIPPELFALSDNEILNEAANKLFNGSQFTILQKNIERFSDGFVIQVALEPKQTNQNTPISEWFLFWLADGRQYFLIFTSSQNGFNQNAMEFEKSVYSFYVSPEKTPTVPEFGPVSALILLVSLSSILVFGKFRKHT